MITLYGFSFSPNSRKVQWLLSELGIEHRFVSVNLMAREQKSPEFLRINPNGRVPVLDDDGFILWESNAILWYLADKFGHGTVVPSDVKERARVDQWLWWQASDLGPACGKPFYLKVLTSPEQFDAAAFDQAVAAAHRYLFVLDQHLAERTFMVGDQLTIADIALAESVWSAVAVGVGLDEHPAVKRWSERLSCRPAVQATRPGART